MKSTTMATVAQTYRCAVKIGDDYVTLECIITLPIGATDEDVQNATALSTRIYVAQHDAIAAQVQSVRDTVTPPTQPPTARQLGYIRSLRNKVSEALRKQIELELGFTDPTTAEEASAMIARFRYAVDKKEQPAPPVSADAAGDQDLPF